MDTVKAACVLDYPKDRYRIFVCDDGASVELRTAVEDHAVQYPHLHYHARVKGPIKDYKAGNLNAGLQYSGSLHPLTFSWPVSQETLAAQEKSSVTPKSPAVAEYSVDCSTIDLGVEHGVPVYTKLAPWGQYVAGLDADMIPEPHWLRALIPHIESDPQCAMVCPPQVRCWRLSTHAHSHGS